MAWKNYAELLARLDGYVANQKLIPLEEFDAVTEMLKDDEVKERLGFELYRDAKINGDFSQFEKLHPILRNYAAAQYMWEMPNYLKNIMQGRQEESYEELKEAFENNPAAQRRLNEGIAERAMNPLFRLGCSLMSRDDWRYTYYDDLATEHLMCETLRPMNSDQLTKVRQVAGSREKGDEQILQNIEKQVQVARTLLMAHIGNTYVHCANAVNENPMNQYEQGYNELKSRSVSSMVSHCSRTAFILPPGENTSKMIESAVGSEKGKANGLYGRLAATHSSTNGASFKDYKEGKGANLSHHYGMDVAIGGFGNMGISGNRNHTMSDRLLKNDGSCGHMYMRIDEGDRNKTSSLLIGFESDSPSAKQNRMSSFLGQRDDEFGDKYGGRKVDCTGFTPDQLSNILDTFSNHYRTLLLGGIENAEIAGRAMLVNRILAGNPIGDNYDKLAVLFNQAGIEADAAVNMANACAQAKVRAAEMMKDQPDLNARPQYVVGPLDNPAQELDPLPEMKKPSLWVRFKAKLGIASAARAVEAYQGCRLALENPTSDPMMEAEMPADAVRAARGNRGVQREQVIQRQEIGMNVLLDREDPQINRQRVSNRRDPEHEMGGRAPNP